jgi:hypothetical protein
MVTGRIRFICITIVAAALCACSANSSIRQAAPLPLAGGASDMNEGPIGFAGTNLIKDQSFEKPVVPSGGFLVFSTGQTFSKWSVVGAGNIGIVSGTFSQNGYTFPAGCGKQWVDLTGLSQSATGVAQTVHTVSGKMYTLRFSIGNVVDPIGIFGTTSTVHVLLDGNAIFSATNSGGSGKTKQVWKKFSTTFTAQSTSATITFMNGDPSTDTNDGLDCISLT